jgi:hypothetical protein
MSPFKSIIGRVELRLRAFRWRRLGRRERIALGGLALEPVRIDGKLLAGSIEFCDLIGGQIPTFGSQILAQLLFVARADDDR